MTSATSSLIRSAWVIGQTRVICGVCTITVSLSPTTATSRPSSVLLITRLSRASTSTLTPCRALPWASRGNCSPSAANPPTSCQVMGSRTATTSAVPWPWDTGSITA